MAATVLSIDLMRYRPDAPHDTMDYLFVELILYAKAQGYKYFNLGMAPLAGVGETRYARAGEKVARLAFEYGNRFYNYEGLRSVKEKFHPDGAAPISRTPSSHRCPCCSWTAWH